MTSFVVHVLSGCVWQIKTGKEKKVERDKNKLNNKQGLDNMMLIKERLS